MAWQIPASSSGGATILLGTADSLFIAAQVAVTPASNYGFDASGIGQRVIIHGTIAANIGGIIGATLTSDTASWLQIGATGRLQAFSGTGFLAYGSTRIDNAGTISSLEDRGVFIQDMGTNGTGSRITNSGLIEGATVGVRIESNSSSSLTLINNGTISGGLVSFIDASSLPHTDLITNNGTFIGNMDLGGGNDLFDGRRGISTDFIFGGAGNDRIFTGIGNQAFGGDAGNDTLMGGAGADAMDGGTGNDDVSYGSATTGVVASLLTGGQTGDARGDTFFEIENMIGSAFNDTLVGNTVANRLIGGAGNDVLSGHLGNDILFGQTGRDVFVFNTLANPAANVDRIMDYNLADDLIRIDDIAFTGIGPTGALAATAFAANATGLATDATDRIIYNITNGALYFDADGLGGTGRVLFGFVSPGLAMTYTEFQVV